jgi:predicted transcriptional regulator
MAVVASVEMQAETLAQEFATLVKRQSLHARRYRVTLEEVEESDAEKLALLKADIAAGLKEADEGRCVDGETMFAQLRAELAQRRV